MTSDNKPSWDDAPDWAGWLAQDASGQWCWFELQPSLADDVFAEPSTRGKIYEIEGSSKPNPNWHQTLEHRPGSETLTGESNEKPPLSGLTFLEPKPSVVIPPELIGWFEVQPMIKLGYRLEIDRNGLRGYKDDE